MVAVASGGGDRDGGGGFVSADENVFVTDKNNKTSL